MKKMIWSYLWPYKYSLILAVFFLLIAKILEAYVPVAIGKIADQILSGSFTGTNAIINASLGVMALLLASYVMDNVTQLMKNWIGQNALFRLRNDVYFHLLRLPIRYYNTQRVGTLMTRTIHDVDQITQMFSEGIVPLIGSMLLFLGIAFFLTWLDWRLALLLIVIFPFVYVLTNWFRINQRRCYGLIRHVLAKMNAFVQEHLLGASTIRSFGLQQEEEKKFEAINEEYRQVNYETIRYFAIFVAGIDFVQGFTLISVFVLISYSGSFQPGLFFTFSLYVIMLFRPLADLAERYNMLQAAFAAFERIYEVFGETLEKEGKGPPIDQIESIEFREVWFAYKGEEWILKGTNFRIDKGESVALVGMTGSGKTTVLNLLLRFYECQKGSILINDKDIKTYSLHEVRGLFSVVLQDPEIFSGTLLENISLYDPEITSEKALQAAAYVSLDSILDKSHLGINQLLDERGKSFSAGEKQLISFARAVAHDRSCFLLDEATSNIDTANERKIQIALEKILRRKMALVVAHRLSTIQDVNRIFVLHEGRVVESGSHQELVDKKGFYEKLYRLQFVNTP